MKKLMIGLLGATVMLTVAPQAMAKPHHHDDNDGLRLAAGIVNLVKAIIAPAPVVVAPAPAPVVVAPPPAPVVVQPQVVVAPPRPVVVTPPPRPVVVQPQVVVAPPRPVVVTPPPAKHHRPAPPPRGGHRGGHRR